MVRKFQFVSFHDSRRGLWEEENFVLSIRFLDLISAKRCFRSPRRLNYAPACQNSLQTRREKRVGCVTEAIPSARAGILSPMICMKSFSSRTPFTARN